MNAKIIHDKGNQRFYIEEGGEKSELKYRKIDEKTLDYYMTFVPESLRHQGVGGEMTDHALQYAKDNDYQIVPSCPYVKQYIEKHPKHQSLVKEKSEN